MEFRTENLTILFVDIAGFTEKTSRQSRAENAMLLNNFQSVLNPIVKGFKGKVVKNIGDARLITFATPTDAMLCAMALQDAMHEHNLKMDEQSKIHIRVAANLGEVRVEKNDIFGEPVNVASRIEGVTPANEIYLSEAVYMAMNKAEVPVQEVGLKKLSGVSQQVMLYCIPRFSNSRLVPQLQPPETDEEAELMFPYGGMHHRIQHSHFHMPFEHYSARKKWGIYLLAIFIGVASAATYNLVNRSHIDLVPANDSAATTPESSSRDSNTNNVQETEQTATTTDTSDVASEASKQQSQQAATLLEQAKEQGRIDGASSKSASQTSVQVVTSDPPQVSAEVKSLPPVSESTKTETQSQPKQLTQPKVETKPQPKPTISPIVVTKPPVSTTSKALTDKQIVRMQWNVTTAKQAYRDERMTKEQYVAVIAELKQTYRDRITQIKADYRAEKITREQYEELVRQAKLDYKGS